ncbi:MAG: FKBP-type peptidyl-prolyl cis-trans isomerase [Bacteroidales bacterium]|jgi:FKBP-type peptidyl-prolyl cis-trans isomerase|nr:FKBP-type peptidyl-prolyl cis-trans isomerase [Bacteroidales bacterium]
MRIIKILGIALVFTTSISTINCQELKTKLDSAAYVMGSQMGEYYFLNQIEINIDALVAGLRDGYTANRLKVQEPEKSEVMKAFEEYMQQKQQEKTDRDSRFNKEVAKSILEQNRQNKDIKETSSGLQYQVITEGKGKKPVASDKVKVHYVGTLFNGTVFDSSRSRNAPAVFGLTQVIPGWTEGLQLMTEGSTYKFWIPSELGYGNRAVGNIPSGSLLIFEVELIEINPAE